MAKKSTHLFDTIDAVLLLGDFNTHLKIFSTDEHFILLLYFFYFYISEYSFLIDFLRK